MNPVLLVTNNSPRSITGTYAIADEHSTLLTE